MSASEEERRAPGGDAGADRMPANPTAARGSAPLDAEITSNSRREGPAGDRPRAILREVALVYVGVGILTIGLTQLLAVDGVKDYVHLLVGALFLWSAMRLAQREDDGPRRFGIDLGGVLGPGDPDRGYFADLFAAIRRALPSGLLEIAVAVFAAMIIFPPFAYAFFWWNSPGQPFLWRPPQDLAGFAMTQLIVVALPEEAFFRGYLQTRLRDVFAKRVRFLGAEVSVPALILQAALFAALHFFVDLEPARLAVFFPGLLFGYFRTLRGGIGAAMVFHAMSNVFSEILVGGWLDPR